MRRSAAVLDRVRPVQVRYAHAGEDITGSVGRDVARSSSTALRSVLARYVNTGEDSVGFRRAEPEGRQGTAVLRTIEDDRATNGRGCRATIEAFF